MPENLRTLRRKREIVGEIQQITRAMKLVSAAKLKRSLSWREATQAYFEEIDHALGLVAGQVEGEIVHPLVTRRPARRIGLLLCGGDKGLCGAFNASILAKARQFVRGSDVRVQTYTVGTRTAEMARRARLNVVREFPAISERQRGSDVQDIVRYVMHVFESGTVDRVEVCYARFLSRITNEPVIDRVLPAPLPEVRVADRPVIFEPDVHELVQQLVPQHVTARIFQALLSSAASEHSARLMAMTAATENAEEMISDLTRDINRARQAEITSELLDVVSGADALQRHG